MPKSIHRAEYRRLIEALRAMREAQGLTQAEFARSLRRSQQWVSLLEGGSRRLDVVEYVELCLALNTDPHALLDSVISRVKSSTGGPAPPRGRRVTAVRPRTAKK